MSSKRRISVNGSSYEVDVIEQNRERVRFSISNRIFEVAFEDEVIHNHSQSSIEQNRQRDRSRGERSRASSGNTIVTPIPGLVVEILVSPTDRISAGAVVAKIEAMKMQNSITAPRDGVIKEVCVKIGAEVSDGEVLLVLEPA